MSRTTPPRVGGSEESSAPDAAELAELIAVQRALLERHPPCASEECAERLALEATLRLLTERFRQARVAESSPLSSLQQAAQLVVPYEFSVPESHRARGGALVTGLKRAFVEGLKPFHVELLRPQESFNRGLVRVLEQLSVHLGLGLHEDLEPWLRAQLVLTEPPPPLSPGGLARRSYLGAVGPLLEALRSAQAEWNAAMLEVLVARLRPGGLDAAEATRQVARLEALSDPLRREGLPATLRATSPLWREVLRRQARFNSEAVLALANLLGVRTPPPQPPSLSDYEDWCARREPGEIDVARAAVSTWHAPPLVSLVVVPQGTPEPLLREGLASLEAQLYPAWEGVVVVESSSASHRMLETVARRSSRLRIVSAPSGLSFAGRRALGLQATRGGLVGFLSAGDTLAPHALAEAVSCLEATRSDAVYADEDRLDERGQRSAPFFKPDWSPDLLRSVDYLGPFVIARRAALEKAGGMREGFEGAEDHELHLRLGEKGAIAHVPRILCHRRLGLEPLPWEAVARSGVRALSEHLERRGVSAEVSSPGPARYRVHYRIQGTPRVSIIIPFKDRPDLLDTLVTSLLKHTRYSHYELLLVSNNSTRPETYALLERLTDPRLVKLRWDHPFNYPAINNWAAKQATGELLLFLNNDMEVVDPGWLEELVGQAQRPEVGAVGAKLLFPEGTVQHAGVVVGMTGFAGHPFWRLPDGPISTPFGHTEWTRDWLSVTSACVMLRREVFESLEGFDERFLLCGSDVELGLRLNARGLWVVCTPFARLIHHESASRRSDAIPEVDYWLSYAAYRPWLQRGDPFYNPQLTLLSVDCDLRRHAEDGEALAVRTLGRDVPSAREPGLERLARTQRHLVEHLEEWDFSEAERERQRRETPEALVALRARGRVETVTWVLPALEPRPASLSTLLGFAEQLRRRHGVANTFLVHDVPGASAVDFLARARASAPEGVGEWRELRGREGLAGLSACDLAIATHWTSVFPVLRHPRAGVRARFLQELESRLLPVGTRSALIEQTYGLGFFGLFAGRALHDHLRQHHGMHGVAFEPPVDGALFHGRRPERRGPVRVFFHAHPRDEREGFELGLAALTALKREWGEAVEWVCAGAAWNPEAYGVRGQVTHLGVLAPERLAALYRECDVGLWFAFTPGPSRPALEMMACGMTVITHDVPGASGPVRHEDNGLRAVPTRTGVLEQLRRAVREPLLRERLGTRAAADVAGLTWERAVNDVLRGLLEGAESSS